MKFLLLLAILVSCASKDKKQPAPTDAEMVAGLQNMCKESSSAMKERQAKTSLYNRLGEREKISVFAEKLYDAHKNNKQIGHMFEGISKEPFVRNVTEFLVVGTGGKGKYSGRDMSAVHKHLMITNSDFLSAGGDVQAVMKSLNYGENEIQEITCALVSFIPVVVKK
jgi:hemoglobin